MRNRLTLRIAGRVQGVNYRAFTCDQARRLGLEGVVWNNHDGTVGLIAEGEEDALRALQAWCQQGPPWAEVVSVTAQQAPATGEFNGFTITRVR